MSGSNKHRHYSDKKASTNSAFIAKVPIVLLSMMLSGLLLLLISAYFALKTDSPLLLSSPLSAASLYICSFIGGTVCALMLGHPESYFAALLSSSAFALIILIMKAVIPQSSSSPRAGVSVIMHSLIVISCLAGVAITEKCRSHKNRRHKIRR